MKNFKVEKNIIQAVLNYLSTRPFKEVAGLIQELQKSEKIIEQHVNDKKPTEE